MRNANESSPIWIILGPLFVIVGAGLWGIETLFRINLNTRFDSDVLVFHEHLFCIVFALPYFLISFPKLRRDFGNIPKSAWIYLLLSGVIGSAIGTIFFTLSLKMLNASVANVLLNFQPIITVASATLLLKERPGRAFFLWAAVAIVCGIVIASNDFNLSELKVNVGLLFIGLAALSWGFSTVAGRGAMLHLPLGTAVFARFVIGYFAVATTLLLQGKFSGDFLKWDTLTDPFVLENYLWLSLVAGVIPLVFYFKGLSKTSASVGGFCELTQTFVALVVTWGVLKHPLTISQVIAGIVLLACVYMINLNFTKANPAVRG